jgi:hypothetical protein
MDRKTLLEPARRVPVIDEVDICVLGGSCTGVSAALRAARLGARVAIVEQENCFGGAATCGMVCIWHSLENTDFTRQIIAGTTLEMIERLKRRPNAIEERLSRTPPYRMANAMAYYLNTEELKIELDEMIAEAKIRPYLHTFYAAPWLDHGELKAVLVENKSGRGAIRAPYFVDATADGDLLVHLGVPHRSRQGRQPSTTGARIYGLDQVSHGEDAIPAHLDEYRLNNIGWSCHVPGAKEVVFWAMSNVCGRCEEGNELTAAEIEGRRQNRAMMDAIRKYSVGGDRIALLALGSRIGIRETRNIDCQYTTTFEDLTQGRRFEDAVVNSAYPCDIHFHDKPGAAYYYLDGVLEHAHCQAAERFSRWRPATADSPTFWQIPLRSLVPATVPNVVVCGRAIDVDPKAFGAARVMVNLNQTGEAAGVAAFEALNTGKKLQEIDGGAVRRNLAKGGSMVI